MTLAASTLSDILLNATEDDLTRIYATAKSRAKTLREVRASAVQVGALAEVTNISPKYLSGLQGIVTKSRFGKAGTFALQLSAASTDTLRWTNQSRHFIDSEANTYLLDGLPASTLKVLTEA